MKKLIGGAAITLAALTMTAGFVFAKGNSFVKIDKAAKTSQETGPGVNAAAGNLKKAMGKRGFGNDGFCKMGPDDMGLGINPGKMAPGPADSGIGFKIRPENIPQEAKDIQAEIKTIIENMQKAEQPVRDQMLKLGQDFRAQIADNSISADQRQAILDKYKSDIKGLRDKMAAICQPYQDQIAAKQKEYQDAIIKSLPQEAQTLINDINSLRSDMQNATKDLQAKIDTLKQEAAANLSNSNLTKEEKKAVMQTYKMDIKNIMQQIKETSQPYQQQINEKQKALNDLLRPAQNSTGSAQSSADPVQPSVNDVINTVMQV